MKIILYDDFNHELRPPDVIGTVRQTFGAWAFTNGWKIIEVHETENLHDRPNLEK